jgi:hypothetical protein
LTRIIRSLRVLGLEEEALAFYMVISQTRKVGTKSRTYWARAATRPLNIAPHVDDEDIDAERCIGPKFLWEFEQERRARDTSVKEGHETVTVEGENQRTGVSLS